MTKIQLYTALYYVNSIIFIQLIYILLFPESSRKKI